MSIGSKPEELRLALVFSRVDDEREERLK